MKFRIKSQEDFLSGLMFIGFGIAAIIISRDYPMGSAMRMGPGYFPTCLGGIMAALGAVIAARSTVVQGEGVSGFALRPLIMLCVAFFIYGKMMDLGAGFIPSISTVVIISSFSIADFRPVELILMTAVLALGTTALFIWGLELPYPLFWWSY